MRLRCCDCERAHVSIAAGHWSSWVVSAASSAQMECLIRHLAASPVSALDRTPRARGPDSHWSRWPATPPPDSQGVRPPPRIHVAAKCCPGLGTREGLEQQRKPLRRCIATQPPWASIKHIHNAEPTSSSLGHR